MTTLTIELNKANAVTLPDGTIDWVPALRAAALEVQQLDLLAKEGTSFPRPIGNNPDAMTRVTNTDGTFGPWVGTVEGFLGAVNTPPSADGMVMVRTDKYEWINLRLIPAMPTTFSFILGVPPQAGSIA